MSICVEIIHRFGTLNNNKSTLIVLMLRYVVRKLCFINPKEKGINMDVGKTIKQVAAVVAVVSAFAALPSEALLLCVLGLASGWYMAEGDTVRVLVTAAALNVGGVAGGADAIPTIGPMIGDILGAMGAVYTAAAVTMVVMGVVNRLKP